MSETGKLMNFEEFRASCDALVEVDLLGAAVRQQREHFQNTAAAEAITRAGALGMMGWAAWPEISVPVTH